MSLLQAALETYNSQQMLVGVSVAGQQTLSPISHAFQNARIELALDENGAFVNARALAKAEGETIIPVTTTASPIRCPTSCGISRPLAARNTPPTSAS